MKLRNIVTINDFGSVNGGVSQVCISAAIGLRRLGLESYYFCGSAPVDGRLEEEQVQTICLGLPSILENPSRIDAAVHGIWNRRAMLALQDLLRGLDPSETIVHVHGWPKVLSASVFALIERLSFPNVITLHDYFTVCPNGGFYNYQTNRICTKQAMSLDCICTHCDSRSYPQKLWRVARQFAVRQRAHVPQRLSNVIYISELSKQVLQPYFRQGTRWFYCRNPVSLLKQARIEAERNDNFLFVGRLSSEKGVDLFAQAVTRAGVSASVVGDGELLPGLRSEFPAIQYWGWQDTAGTARALSSARALIFPSKWYETLGLTVLEALSVGVPVLVAEKTAACELVRPGVNGLLFESGRIDSIVEGIKKLQDHQLVKAMSQSAYDTFWQNPPTLEKHCQNLIEIYHEILQ
ncbi:MAG: glycosyltransferase [bacterium]|nr:glycosyltransferase [bacterium]